MVLLALFTWRWGDTRRNNSRISKVSRVTVQGDTGGVMLDAYTWYVWIVIASEKYFSVHSATLEHRNGSHALRGTVIDICSSTSIL